MKKDFTEFEKSIREGMEGFEMPFDQNAWQSMNRRLDGKNVIWNNTVSAAVVTALIFASGLTYVLVNHYTDNTAQTSGSESNLQTTHLEDTAQVIENQESSVDFRENTQADDSSPQEGAEGGIISQKLNGDKGLLVQEKVSENKNAINLNQNTNSEESLINNNETVVDNDLEVRSNESGSSESSGSDGEDNGKDNSAPFINVSQPEVCAGEKIEFTAENITDEAKFLWNFGNADFSTEVNPVRVFDEPGQYNISLILSKSSKKIESQIIVLPKPLAKFSWKEQSKGAIKLSNLSDKAATSEWKVGEDFESNDINPVYNYDADGKKLVSLKVVNDYGCTDSTLKYIHLSAPMKISAPETLKFGEEFSPKVVGLTNENMVLTIHNLAGQLIYETDQKTFWDGTMPDGNYAGPGSEFAWLVIVKNDQGLTVSSSSGIVKIIP